MLLENAERGERRLTRIYCAAGKKTKETKKKQSAAPPVAAKGKGKLFAIQCLSFSVFACGWARIIRKICDSMLRP
jgi:hypothetical protein